MMDLREPEKAIYKVIISGNIPDFLRTFVEIQRRGKTLGVLTVGHKRMWLFRIGLLIILIEWLYKVGTT